MSVQLINRPSALNAAVPLREMLGYDPFRRLLAPADADIDVAATERGWTVEIPVPGYRPDQIDITVKDDVLTIAARSEKRAVTRTLRLPQDVDADQIEALTENGMLTIELSRHPHAEPRKIEVKPRSV